MTRKQSRRTQRALERALFGPLPTIHKRKRATVSACATTPIVQIGDWQIGDCPFCGNSCEPAPGITWVCPECKASYEGK